MNAPRAPCAELKVVRRRRLIDSSFLPAGFGLTRMMRHLLRRGADINAGCMRDVIDDSGEQLMAEGTRPVHIAIGNGRLDALSLLLREGADPNPCNSSDRSPLTVALSIVDSAQRLVMTRVLLEANADAAGTDSLNRVPIHLAAAQGSTEAVGMLLSQAPETIHHTADSNRATPLYAAAEVRPYNEHLRVLSPTTPDPPTSIRLPLSAKRVPEGCAAEQLRCSTESLVAPLWRAVHGGAALL